MATVIAMLNGAESTGKYIHILSHCIMLLLFLGKNCVIQICLSEIIFVNHKETSNDALLARGSKGNGNYWPKSE